MEKEKRPHQNKNDTDERTPLHAPKVDAKRENHDPKYKSHETKYHLRSSALDWSALGIQILTLIAVIYYAYWAREQAGAMWKAAASTKVAADAAQAQVIAAEKSTHLDQRAWLSMGPINLTSPPVAGKPISVTVNLLNSGRTPAKNVTIDWSVEVRTPGSLPPFSYSRDARFFVGSAGPTGQNGFGGLGYQSFSKEPATSEFVTAFAEGKASVYAHGCVSYADVFGQTHWTSYCVYFQKDRVSEFQGRMCGVHNDSGDQEGSHCS